MPNSRNRFISKWTRPAVILFLMIQGTAAADMVIDRHAFLTPESTSVDVKEGIEELLSCRFPTESDSLPVLIQFYDTLNRPEIGVPCTLTVETVKHAQSSDKNGEVLFRLSNADIGKDIQCNAFPTRPVEAYWYTFINEGAAFEMRIFKRKAYFLTGKDMSELSDAGIRVLYTGGYEEKARQMLAIFTEEKKIIEKAFGIRLLPFKVILTDSPGPYISMGGYGLTPNSGSYADGETYWYFPHEWVETSLVHYYQVYDDSTNRWIGDGLANYIALEICSRLYPQSIQKEAITLNEYKESNEVYDLESWLTCDAEDRMEGKELELMKGKGTTYVGWAGYKIAPYFWAKVVGKSGNPAIIAEFLQEFKKQEDKSRQGATTLLSGLSGLDIDKELVITGRDYAENVISYWPIPVPLSGMTLIFAGNSFLMGDSVEESTSPPRTVRLESYFLDCCEVTNAQFAEFLNAMGNRREESSHWLDERNNTEIERVRGKYQPKPGYENYPVRWVTWHGAAAYAKWAGKRLPTEAEWEFAASNNGTTYYPWDDGKWHDDYCNWGEEGKLDGFASTAPVDTFARSRNHYDCLNMVGNVSEWVSDWYAPYNPTDTVNPRGPVQGTLRAYRGGGYGDGRERQTTKARRGADPAQASPEIGFRCARDLPGLEPIDAQ